tara:strand:- start:652 stop:1320 length:669 start_codon:yes stop_codon:yes gene_type:complete
MKICFLTKIEKLGVKEAIAYTKKIVKNLDCLDIYYGKPKDKIPKKLFNIKYDLLISYISPWIIPETVLAKTKKWNLNFHPGPPEYPGIGCFNFAIYDSVDQFGATAHIMEPKVDTGEIIGVEHFSITKNETVESLSIKTYNAQLDLFKKILSSISENNCLPKSEEKWKRKPFRRFELEQLATIDLNMSKNEIEKRIRATYFPGKPSPFIEIYGKRYEYNPNR